MKRILSIISVLFTATILSGSGNKSAVWKYELPLSFYGENDSIPTINQFGQVRNGIIVDNIISIYNADPNGVDLTNTQIEAFRMLVGGMYTTGTWQKCKSIYPFIGGSEYKHKWNIKDLRDLDAAFRLSFIGGPTHSANGIQFDGVNDYADTFFVPSTNLTYRSTSVSIYVRSIGTSVSNTPYIFGASHHTNNTDGFRMSFRRTNLGGSANTSFFLSDGLPNDIARFNAPSTQFLTGLYTGNVNGGNISLFYQERNIAQDILRVGTTTTLSNLKCFIGAQSNIGNTPNLFSNHQISFLAIGSGLTDSEIIRTNQIVTQVQRHLSRQ